MIGLGSAFVKTHNLDGAYGVTWVKSSVKESDVFVEVVPPVTAKLPPATHDEVREESAPADLGRLSLRQLDWNLVSRESFDALVKRVEALEDRGPAVPIPYYHMN